MIIRLRTCCFSLEPHSFKLQPPLKVVHFITQYKHISNWKVDFTKQYFTLTTWDTICFILFHLSLMMIITTAWKALAKSGSRASVENSVVPATRFPAQLPSSVLLPFPLCQWALEPLSSSGFCGTTWLLPPGCSGGRESLGAGSRWGAWSGCGRVLAVTATAQPEGSIVLRHLQVPG